MKISLRFFQITFIFYTVIGMIYLLRADDSARINWSAYSTDEQSTLWYATQKIEVGMEPETAFYEIDLSLPTLNPKKIELPEGWRGREIFAIFPTTEKILVLSQWTFGGGDLPKYAFYERKKKTWSHSKSGGCIQFSQLVAQKDRLEFRCEDPGTGKPFSKTIAVRVPGVKRHRDIHFPQADSLSGEFRVRGLPSGQIEFQKTGNPQKRVIPFSP